MLKPILLFIVGLVCLIKGGDWFVDGASSLARKFQLPELLIGATVVSIGTTLPEVMVSTMSALSGHGEIAYGNAIGSVICNTALIAAITVAVRPAKVNRKALLPPDTSELQSNYVAPTNEVEQTLCEAFASIFGMEQVGIDDDFFMLG
jgi:cation:H+ antiporter